MQDGLEVLRQEGSTQAVPRVGHQRIDLALADRLDQVHHAVGGGQVRLHGLDLRTQPLEILHRIGQRRVGRHHQVVAVLRRAARQVVADP
ncbi:hypothetical protein D9M68_990520 [compost metagenome]